MKKFLIIFLIFFCFIANFSTSNDSNYTLEKLYNFEKYIIYENSVKNDGIYTVKDIESGLFGCINSKGEFVIEPNYKSS